jgi:hypothetical protein
MGIGETAQSGNTGSCRTCSGVLREVHAVGRGRWKRGGGAGQEEGTGKRP